MSLFERLTSLFAPDECLVCRRQGSLLCDSCTDTLPAPSGACFSCHRSVKGVVCDDCLMDCGLESIRAVANYSGVAKQLVAALKFMGNQSAAMVMADHMASSLPMSDGLIIHVPATAQHIRERGYDQAALLARQLARVTGRSRATLLVRSGRQHQLGSDRHERLAQLSGALRIRQPERLRGRPVLLIDDVLTTGASIRAATGVLLAAGAARVDALVFAQSISLMRPATK